MFPAKYLLLLAIYVCWSSVCTGFVPTYHTSRLDSVRFLANSEANKDNEREDIPSLPTRRIRKNKYASKSKTPSLDPLESLLLESQQKNEALKTPSKLTTPTPHITKKPTLFPDSSLIDPSSPSTFGFTYLGYILSAHSLSGSLLLLSSTSFSSSRILKPGYLGLKPPNRGYPRERLLIEGKKHESKKGGKGGEVFIVNFQGIETREEAEMFKGYEVWVREERDTEISDDIESNEVLIKHLISLPLFSLSDPYYVLGHVESVVLKEDMNVGGLGNDLLDVKLVGGKNCYIPFVKEICKVVEVDKGVWIDEPEGLLDLAVEKEEKVKIKGLLKGYAED
ncbi:hypothetical protein TrLO_g13684 [Triparma laevis f. longispina]|uniref:RimM N-terminal domain-containing protein n=1 Tax=Triparma laevis f. longispina TaxID=1714387 RepID=A0A9W7DVH9_9STRA|nr:hypothetical protein TrLO_g13684 [Triparma laevis f. longispina]